MKTLNTILEINKNAFESIQKTSAPESMTAFAESVKKASETAVENSKKIALSLQEDNIEFLKKINTPNDVIKQIETFNANINSFFKIK